MTSLPPEPSPGDKISANIVREIIRAIRERTIIQGPGIRTSTGPNGTVVSSTATGNVSRSSAANHQCFDIDSMDDESVTLRDCYYSIGGKSYGSASMSVNQAGGMILSLKVSMSGSPSAELACHSSISSLNIDQQDDLYYIRPLYWFDSDMKVKLDFRNMPDLSPWEFE